jgi:hypothetical protein
VVLPDLRVVMLPDVVMLSDFKVVMLPLRLARSVVMLPAEAVEEIAAVKSVAQAKYCKRFIEVSPGEQIVYWVGRAFGSAARKAQCQMPDQILKCFDHDYFNGCATNVHG